ncbi:MAG: TonB family protein, partial [Oscillatoria sp. PMC 1051.18]|nr:TonB family protein [Oscillatoria sp. PMC 1050.18]MEC5031922.1 TonB family protein [Oscillatoria sp. PMC 1051.18]
SGVPSGSQGEFGSGSPGSVASNNNSPTRPGSVSSPLSGSGSDRTFRDNFGSGSASGVPSGSQGEFGSGSPGSIASNNNAPTRPGGVSSPLNSNSGGGFSGDLSGGNAPSNPGGSQGSFDSSNPGSVAANRGAPARAPSGSGQGGSCAQPEPVYPSSLQGRNIKDEVKVAFVVDQNGNVSSPQLVEPSKYNELNQAALDAVGRMSCQPTTGRNRRVEVTIRFD